MNLKNEKCVMIFSAYNQKSSLIIKDLLQSHLKLRIITDNLKGFKTEFFDVWEKFESVNQLDINNENFTKQKEKFFGARNNIIPEYILLIKTSNSNRKLYSHEIELINYLKSQSQIKKIIYVNINNTQRTSFNKYKSINKEYTIDSDYDFSVEKIFNFYLEAAIRQSGRNYLIIKNLQIQENSSVFSEDHKTFTNTSDFILNKLNLINYKNFKELIFKVIDGKIFVDDSTYVMDKSNFDLIIKYSTPQYIFDYLNFMCKDFYIKKISYDSHLIKEDRIRLSESSKDYTLLGISCGLKLLTYSIRFFINTYK